MAVVYTLVRLPMRLKILYAIVFAKLLCRDAFDSRDDELPSDPQNDVCRLMIEMIRLRIMTIGLTALRVN